MDSDIENFTTELKEQIAGAEQSDELVLRGIEKIEIVIKAGGACRLRAYNALGSLLSIPRAEGLVWDWLVKHAELADREQRVPLAVSIFELLASEPVDIYWLRKLFSLLSNKKCWWIFGEIYEGQPSKFYDHFLLVMNKGK